MDTADVDKIWDDVTIEASNRSRGAFKRALWYGNKSKVFGQNKGLRKGIRNAPKKIMLGALDFTGLAPGLSSTVGNVADLVMSNVKDMYSGHVKPLLKNKPLSAEENLRKRVKADIKNLKSNAFQVIDRNLVKLKDAGKKIGPAVQALMAAAPDMTYQKTSAGVGMGRSFAPEKQAQKAYDALRQIAETEYYISKEMGLVQTLKQSLAQLEGDLNKMQEATQKKRKEVMEYIELALD